MKKYDVIAFDLDGTLTNPEGGLLSAFVYAFRKLGIDYGERESLKRFIGPPLYDEWQRVFGFNLSEVTEAIRIFREYYNVYGWWDNRVYEGVEDMLCRLVTAGKTLVVATSKPEFIAKKVLSLFGLDKYFAYIAGASADGTKDFKWQILDRAFSCVGAENMEKCILVGDRKYDAEGAARVGCDSMGVLWGHGTKEEIEASGFNFVVRAPNDAADILTQNAN